MNEFEQSLQVFNAEKQYPIYDSDIKIAKYNGNEYVFSSNGNGECFLYSFDKINETSNKLSANNTYYTQVQFEDIEDIICFYLYVKYKGNIYKLISPSGDFKQMTISTCEECTFNAKCEADGFRYSQDLGELIKRIQKEEAEAILCYSKSIYQKYQKYQKYRDSVLVATQR